MMKAEQWARPSTEILLVGAIFGTAGVACSMALVLTAPFSKPVLWWLTRLLSAAAAAAIAGGGAWRMLCTLPRRYAAWRWIASGLLGGFVCHPLYYLLSPRFDGTWVRLDQLPAEWLLSFAIAGGGVITVPAGLMAAG